MTRHHAARLPTRIGGGDGAMQRATGFTLSANGAQMPAIGYGTMEFPGRAPELVAAAIPRRYRHIHTARNYDPAQFVAKHIRASGIARGELFVTNKVTELDARE